MAKVKFLSEFGSDSFTKNKSYETKIRSEGLMVIDDSGEEHVIATAKNEFNTYDDDTFFRNNFSWEE